MSWRRPAIVVVTGAALTATACSLLIDDDLSGAPDPTNAEDAAASPDASDAAADVAVPVDGQADAAPRGCDASFCDDFDDGALGGKWTKIVKSSSATMAFDDVTFQSPPRSVRFALAGTTSPSQPSRALFQLDLPAVPASFRCGVDIWLESGPATNVSSFDVITLGVFGPADGGVANYNLFASVHSAKTSLRDDVHFGDGGALLPREQLFGPALPRVQWARVELATDFATARMYLNGVEVAVIPDLPTMTRTFVSFSIGGATYASDAWEARIDDVRCQFDK